MAQLKTEEVEHIAKLSKLTLTDKEKELYSKQLSSVLGYIDQLSEVETKGIESLTNVTGLENIYSEDVVKELNISHADIAKNAPEFKDGSFVVPGVFE